MAFPSTAPIASDPSDEVNSDPRLFDVPILFEVPMLNSDSVLVPTVFSRVLCPFFSKVSPTSTVEARPRSTQASLPTLSRLPLETLTSAPNENEFEC